MGTWVLSNVPDSYWHVHDAPNQTNGGPTFRVNPPAFCTALRWWRDGVGRGSPTIIGLWRVSDQFELAHVTPVTDDFNVGWQVSQLEHPVQLVGATDYLVAAFFPSDGGLGSSNSGEALPGGNPTDIQITGQLRHYDDGAPYVYPANTISNYRQALDALIEFSSEVPDPNAPTTVTTLQDSLYSWLHPLGEHFSGSGVDQTLQQTQANHNDLATLLGRLTTTLTGKLDAGMDTIASWLSAESDWYQKLVNGTAPWMANLTDSIGTFTGFTVFNYLAELIRWANGVNQQPQLADTTDWELLDETDFTDNLLWPVEADVYRVTLSSFDPAGTSEPVGTETRHAYLGKWCPFNVQFSSEWHYFNTESADLYLGGRMPGLGLVLYRPGAGHVQAWRRAEAP